MQAARSDENAAQYRLAELYERGEGLPQDAHRAEELLRAAATDEGGAKTIFVPQPGGAIAAIRLSAGPMVKGLPEARAKLAEKKQGHGRAKAPAGFGHSQRSRKQQLRTEWYQARTPSGEGRTCTAGLTRLTVQPCKILLTRPRYPDFLKAAFLENFLAGIDGKLHCRAAICRLPGSNAVLVENDFGCEDVPAIMVVRAEKHIVAAAFCCEGSQLGSLSEQTFVDQDALSEAGISAHDVLAYVQGDK